MRINIGSNIVLDFKENLSGKIMAIKENKVIIILKNSTNQIEGL